MSSLKELLDAVSEDSFMEDLDKMASNNGMRKQAMPMPEPAGAATQANIIGANQPQSTGMLEGGMQPDVLGEQLPDHNESQRIMLQQKAMQAAAASLAAGVEQSRGAGTDEGYNASIQPRSGRQEYPSVAAPAGQMPPEAMSQTMAADAVKAASHDIDDEFEGETKTAAEKIAEECLAQGRFVELGIEMGLQKSAADGTLAGIFMPAFQAAHEVAIEKMAEDRGAIQKLAGALADEFIAAVNARVKGS